MQIYGIFTENRGKYVKNRGKCTENREFPRNPFLEVAEPKGDVLITEPHRWRQEVNECVELSDM